MEGEEWMIKEWRREGRGENGKNLEIVRERGQQKREKNIGGREREGRERGGRKRGGRERERLRRVQCERKKLNLKRKEGGKEKHE